MTGYPISSDEQLTLWERGESRHQHIDDVEGGECCPDFSCCHPGMLWSAEKRK